MLVTVGLTAVAGLNASAHRLAVAAGNIANARSGGTLEPYDGYVPQQHVQSSTATGLPRAGTRDVSPAAVPAYQPGHPDADADGLIGLPNVDLAANIVDLTIAQRAYEANLVTLRTASEMARELVDETA